MGLYPPLGSNPPPQDRRGAVYPLCYDELLSALLFRPFLLPPACHHPLSGISPFAWGCAQQRVEEPHGVSGYPLKGLDWTTTATAAGTLADLKRSQPLPDPPHTFAVLSRPDLLSQRETCGGPTAIIKGLGYGGGI